MRASELTPDQARQAIYNEARANNTTDALAKLIAAQSGHETDGWTSDVWMQDNNGFGFGYDGNGGYYIFDSIEASVDALVGWLATKEAAGTFPALATISDPNVYAQALKDNSYYEDSESNYAAGLSRWFDDNLQMAAGISVAAVVGIGLLLFLLIKK